MHTYTHTYSNTHTHTPHHTTLPAHVNDSISYSHIKETFLNATRPDLTETSNNCVPLIPCMRKPLHYAEKTQRLTPHKTDVPSSEPFTPSTERRKANNTLLDREPGINLDVHTAPNTLPNDCRLGLSISSTAGPTQCSSLGEWGAVCVCVCVCVCCVCVCVWRG